jgi:hypothetical protein
MYYSLNGHMDFSKVILSGLALDTSNCCTQNYEYDVYYVAIRYSNNQQETSPADTNLALRPEQKTSVRNILYQS